MTSGRLPSLDINLTHVADTTALGMPAAHMAHTHQQGPAVSAGPAQPAAPTCIAWSARARAATYWCGAPPRSTSWPAPASQALSAPPGAPWMSCPPTTCRACRICRAQGGSKAPALSSSTGTGVTPSEASTGSSYTRWVLQLVLQQAGRQMPSCRHGIKLSWQLQHISRLVHATICPMSCTAC